MPNRYNAGDKVQAKMPDGTWASGTVSAGYTSSSGLPIPVDLGQALPWPVASYGEIRPQPAATKSP